VAHLSSFLWKGWACHQLVRATAACRWTTSQEATLLGAAVSTVAPSVTGEAARIRYMMSRDGVPGGVAAASVAWSRVGEALGLAVFLILAPFLLQLPPVLRGIQWMAGVGLAVALAGVWSQRLIRVSHLLPRRVRSFVAALSAMGSPRRLVGPTLFALLNWAAQWAVFHLALLAVHAPATPAASFTAVIAANIAGLARLTPGNLGILQASMAGALLPFGIHADVAVAAGLALQAIQTLPVLLLAVLLVGWKGMRRALAQKELPAAPATAPEEALET
jgi:uncharacterized membrane protein YbhN (UPF0104 family)